ncbi:MAG: hypothetical protein WBF33_18925 [Candidatus Nitrosopolaris sp.]|jgi:hypothetical protein
MHEYLRDTLVYRYRECKSCANRTEFTCIKCGFCWSCHWKMEQIERIDLYNKPLPFVQPFRNYSQSIVAEDKRPRKQLLQKLSPTITTVIDVYGEAAEPICDYLRCHHRLSLHGLGTNECKCRHPQNLVVRVS